MLNETINVNFVILKIYGHINISIRYIRKIFKTQLERIQIGLNRIKRKLNDRSQIILVEILSDIYTFKSV